MLRPNTKTHWVSGEDRRVGSPAVSVGQSSVFHNRCFILIRRYGFQPLQTKTTIPGKHATSSDNPDHIGLLQLLGLSSSCTIVESVQE